MKWLFSLFISLNLFGSLQYFTGEAKELDKEGTIELLTWNILGLRNDMVAIRPWEERIDGIAQLIRMSGADVVVLQECFEKDLSMGLYERLKGAYAHIYLHLEADETPMTSGLALFSKLPIGELKFTSHPDLLDTEKLSKLGTIDFVVLNGEQKPIAHIAASHFQGSSNCEWRVGVTDGGVRLSYPEVREQEAKATLAMLSRESPSYLCGDLNVDRKSEEYNTSSLNPKVNPAVHDIMTDFGTNTSFWKHEVGLGRMFSSLPSNQVLELSLVYQNFYQNKLAPYLNEEPLKRSIAEFKPAFLAELKGKLNLTEEEEKIWKYFQLSSLMAVAQEKQLWRANQNPGDFPNVSIGRLLEVRVMPVEESLDYVLSVGKNSHVKGIKVLRGYDTSVAKTLSDHHPLLATLIVAE